MRVCVFALVFVSGCSSCGRSDSPAPAPAPSKPAAAICDALVDTPPAHICTEVYDATLLPETEHWCDGLKGPRDTATFTKNAACPVEGQIGACRLPSGSAEFSYKPTTVSKAQVACGNQHGQFFADTALPEAGAIAVWSCMLTSSKLPPIDGTCLEEESVIDLSKTISKTNCTTINGTFSAGPCPAGEQSGRCVTLAHSVKSTRVFYGNKHDAGVAHTVCDQIAGTFTQ